MSDEHSPHAAGCLGNRIVNTPAIDSLAREGALVTAAPQSRSSRLKSS